MKDVLKYTGPQHTRPPRGPQPRFVARFVPFDFAGGRADLRAAILEWLDSGDPDPQTEPVGAVWAFAGGVVGIAT